MIIVLSRLGLIVNIWKVLWKHRAFLNNRLTIKRLEVTLHTVI
jgi:hypothetical protein